MYSSAKCSAIDNVTAYTRAMFSHNGSVMSDSLDESAFIALNISITTRLGNYQQRVGSGTMETHIESEMVDADFAMLFVNISHPISGNWEEHLWKLDWPSFH